MRLWVSLSRQPTRRRESVVVFGCDPANVKKLQRATYDVVRALQRDGIGADYLTKVSEQLGCARETDANGEPVVIESAPLDALAPTMSAPRRGGSSTSST